MVDISNLNSNYNWQSSISNRTNLIEVIQNAVKHFVKYQLNG
jgi:hypothetical protein